MTTSSSIIIESASSVTSITGPLTFLVMSLNPMQEYKRVEPAGTLIS